MAAIAGHEWRSPPVRAWAEQGTWLAAAGHEVFVADLGPRRQDADLEPVLVLHGFPTCSFDFRQVVATVAARRRVVLVDMLGYGLSDKPDLHYSIDLQADVVAAVTDRIGIDRAALLTHDMGDTVGGELLARQLEGRWPVEVTRRVVTNGSIYIQMAQLSSGQQLLLALPDARLDEGRGADGTGMTASLRATFSPASVVDDTELEAAWELISYRQGQRLLPRTIRYIEDRRRDEERYTGAIESHPSPLTIVWGEDDPIAVVAMAHRLHDVRPDATLEVLVGVGHYPMIEAPGRFLAAVLPGLG
jgi:pimeloyl-ACP methyl ester carboxylesterase